MGNQLNTPVTRSDYHTISVECKARRNPADNCRNLLDAGLHQWTRGWNSELLPALSVDYSEVRNKRPNP